jgi:hypothetical protein
MRQKTSMNTEGAIYIPKKVQLEMGLAKEVKEKHKKSKIKTITTKMEFIANRKTILILPSNMTPEQALHSLEIIKMDLEDEVKEKQQKLTKEA